MLQVFRCIFLALLLLPAVVAGQHAVRLGGQAGAIIESSVRGTVTKPSEVESITTGMAGIDLVFSLDASWFLKCAPQLSQRNYPLVEFGRKSNTTYRFVTQQVDRLGVPVMLGCTPLSGDIVRPYVAAGFEFGMNLSGLQVTVLEVRHAMEPDQETIQHHATSITQLFGALLLEAGFDIRAGSSFSVIFSGRFTRELSPLVDYPLISWEAPRNWTIRLGLLYELPQ